MTIYSFYFKIAVFFQYLIITFWLWFRYRRTLIKRTETFPKADIMIVCLLVFIMIATRCIYSENIEQSVDTSTWISTVISLNHYPDKIWKWLVYTDSRPLTVLPLWATTWLGIKINYTIAEFIGLLFWAGSILLTYRTLRLFIASSLSVLLSWTLCIFIGTTNHDDHVAYNSEHVSIFLLALATYLYVRAEKDQQISLLTTFFLGLVLGSLLFAKFQNVPMGLVIAGFSLQLFARQHKWRHTTWLILGGILPTLVVNLIFLFHGKIDDFWINYFWNYLLYSYTTQFQPMRMGDRFSPVRAWEFLLRSDQSYFYLIALFSSIILCIVTSWNRIPSSFNKVNRYFAVMITISSLYAILQSGNDFIHYTLYIFIPLIYFVGAFSAEMPALFKIPVFTFLLVLCSYQLYINCTTNDSGYMSSKQNRPTDKKVVELIKRYSNDSDNIVIWGWVDRWYYYSDRACGYRMPHSHHLFLKSSLYKSRVVNFLDDLEENKTTLFIDAAIPGWMPIEGMGKPYEFYPEVNAYIHKNYILAATVNCIRIYKRLQK